MRSSNHFRALVIAVLLCSGCLSSCGSSDMGQPMQTGVAGTATLPPAPVAPAMAESSTRGVVPEGTVVMGNVSLAGSAATAPRPMDGEPNLAIEGTPGVEGRSSVGGASESGMGGPSTGGEGVGGGGVEDGFSGGFGTSGQAGSAMAQMPENAGAAGAPPSGQSAGSAVGGASPF